MAGRLEPEKRRAWLLVAKVGVTAVALWWAFSKASLDAMARATADLSLVQLGAAVGLLLTNVFVGAARWHAMMGAFGAVPPRFSFLVRGYLVANFYNTFVPGNVGGDALRAYVTQRAFRHPADAYAVVLLERVFGLSALLLAGGLGTLLGVPEWRLVAVALLAGGFLSLVLAALAPHAARRLAARLPRVLAPLISGLSLPTWRVTLVPVVAWSLISQTASVLSSHVLIAGLSKNVHFVHSLAFVPLAMLSLYVPVSISGLGIREAAFVVLFARIGVSAADATAASLASMAALMIVGMVGGLTHWFAPLDLRRDQRYEELVG